MRDLEHREEKNPQIIDLEQDRNKQVLLLISLCWYEGVAYILI